MHFFINRLLEDDELSDTVVELQGLKISVPNSRKLAPGISRQCGTCSGVSHTYSCLCVDNTGNKKQEWL
jgi:hypothetical protein